jgi:hypothetical protein
MKLQIEREIEERFDMLPELETLRCMVMGCIHAQQDYIRRLEISNESLKNQIQDNMAQFEPKEGSEMPISESYETSPCLDTPGNTDAVEREIPDP